MKWPTGTIVGLFLKHQSKPAFFVSCHAPWNNLSLWVIVPLSWQCTIRLPNQNSFPEHLKVRVVMIRGVGISHSFCEFYWVLCFSDSFYWNVGVLFWIVLLYSGAITLQNAMSHVDLVVCKCKQVNKSINYREYLTHLFFQILASVWTEGIHDDE